MKISSWIIGLMTVTFIVSGISIFLVNINTEYTPTGYNETEIAFFNKLNDLNTDSQTMRKTLYNTSLQPGIVDIIGGYMSAAITSLKYGWTSLLTFEVMAQGAAQASSGEIGEITNDFYTYIVGMAIVAFVIGGLIAAYLKWNT